MQITTSSANPAWHEVTLGHELHVYNGGYKTREYGSNPSGLIDNNQITLTEGGAGVTLSITISNGPGTETFTLEKGGDGPSHSGTVSFDENALSIVHTTLDNFDTITDANFGNERHISFIPTEDDDFLDEMYVFTITETLPLSWVTLDILNMDRDIALKGAAQTLNFTIHITDNDEIPLDFGIRNDPLVNIDEGDWVAITVSVTEARTDPTTLVFTPFDPDSALPEPTSVFFNPPGGSLTITMGNINEHVMSVRYDDDIDSDMPRAGSSNRNDIDLTLTVAITDPAYSNTKNIVAQMRNDDRAAVDIQIAGDLDSRLELVTTVTINTRLRTKPIGNVVITNRGQDFLPSGSTITSFFAPESLLFTPDNWNVNQPMTVSTNTQADITSIIEWFPGVRPHSSSTDEVYRTRGPSEFFQATLTVNLTLTLHPPCVLVCFDTPESIPDEGDWVVISVQLTAASPPETRLEFSGDDSSLPYADDPEGVEFTPTNGVLTIPAGNTSWHAISVRYDDIVDIGTDTRYTINIDVTDGTETTSTPLTFTETDVARFVFDRGTNLGTLGLGGTERIPVRLGTKPTSDVAVTIGYAAETSGITVSISPTELTFTPANWDVDQRFTLTTSMGSTSQTISGYTVTVRPIGDIPDSQYFALSIHYLVMDFDTSIRPGGMLTETDLEAASEALVVVDIGAAQFALDAVGNNFIGDATGGRPQLAPSLNLGGGTGGAVTDPANPWAQDDNWRSDFMSLLDGGSFRLPLSEAGGLGNFEVWGGGRFTEISGDNDLEEGSSFTYDGDATNFVVGFGLRGNSLGYGLAVARTKSEINLDGASLSVERIDKELLTLLPYVGVSFNPRSRAWLVGGIGEGEAELLLSGDMMEKTDTSVRSLGLGIENSVDVGGFDLAGRLLASGSQSRLEETDEAPDLADVKGRGHRLRAEIEAERGVDVGGAGGGDVFVVAALRRDGGDAGSTTGLEFGGGMRARLLEAYSVEIEGRVQANTSSHEEKSVRMRLGYDSDYDGRGLGIGLDEAGGASVGYGWGRSVLGHHGVLSLEVGREGYGEVATTRLGFVSPGLRMSVAGDEDELRADFDLIVLGN